MNFKAATIALVLGLSALIGACSETPTDIQEPLNSEPNPGSVETEPVDPLQGTEAPADSAAPKMEEPGAMDNADPSALGEEDPMAPMGEVEEDPMAPMGEVTEPEVPAEDPSL